MASSFLIMFPDITRSALTYSSSVAFLEDYPLESSFDGKGYTFAKTETPAASVTATFDLGLNQARTVDHLIIGGVQSLRALSIAQVKVEASNDGAVWQEQLGTNSNFMSKTFEGPYQDDIIFTADKNNDLTPNLRPFRYFRLTIGSGGASQVYAFRKLYFGQAFDMGAEPSNYNLEVTSEDDADTWKYPRGHIIMSRAFNVKHRITVEWDGVSDSKANEFAAKILNDPYRATVYLATGNYSDPLYDNKLLHCRVVADQCSVTKSNEALNWNDIVAVFEEV